MTSERQQQQCLSAADFRPQRARPIGSAQTRESVRSVCPVLQKCLCIAVSARSGSSLQRAATIGRGLL